MVSLGCEFPGMQCAELFYTRLTPSRVVMLAFTCESPLQTNLNITLTMIYIGLIHYSAFSAV